MNMTSNSPVSDKVKIPSWRKKRILVVLAVIFLLVVVNSGLRVFLAGNKMFEGSVLGIFSKGLLQTDDYGRSNIIIFGTTEDSEAHRKIGANQYRTDSIMLASINREEKTMILTSVPRDLWVKYESNCRNGSEGKINAVYLCGSDNGKRERDGSKMLMNAVSDVYGLDVHYFVHVNFAGVETMVNAVGGIEVDIESSDSRGIYDPAIGIKYPNGPVQLDGRSALLLSRARDSTGRGYGLAGGNFSREGYQQKILIALRNQIVSRGTLSNPVVVSRLIDSLGDNVRTNFNTKEIRELINLSQDIDHDRVQTVILNDSRNPLVVADRIAGQSVIRPTRGLHDYSDIQAFIRGLITESGS